MKVSKTFLGFLIVVIIIVAAVLIWDSTRGQTPSVYVPPVSSSTSPTFDQNVSDGTITVGYPSAQFALATTPAQILVQSMIPPCSGGFNYCLYYNGTTYQGTNFESAGLRVDKRTDLTTQNACLTTEPADFSNLTPVTYVPAANSSASAPDYATSVFSSVGDAAAGSFASGSLYRLWYAGGTGSCYEFETRIGQSQYGNYPPGSIQQFTSADQATLQSELQSIIANVTLPSGEKPIFPPPAANNS